MFVRVRPGAEVRAHNGQLVAPLHEDGSPYRLEAATDRGWIYADRPGGLLAALIEGYDPAGDRFDRVRARTGHALVVATQLQGELLAGRSGPVLDEEACRVLEQAPYPVTVAVWDAAAELVLLDVHYRPFTALSPPLAVRGAIRWLRPSGEWDYLVSLAEAGRIRLAEHV